MGMEFNERHLERAPRSRSLAVTSLSRVILLGSLGSLGCGVDEPLQPKGTGPAGHGDTGPTVQVEGQSVELGFARGHLTKSVDVDSFSISRSPITIGEYRACVNAGSCKAPHATACVDLRERLIVQKANFEEPGVADDVPVTCVGIAGARQYCTWVRGTLPTLEQWFLATRGPKPQRYSWGPGRATCERHALGRPVAGVTCPDRSSMGKVGLHPAGASPLGAQDVLLTTGELLDTSEKALFGACRSRRQLKTGSDRECVAYGLDPGAIDSVLELRSTPERPESSPTAYGFRCAWGGDS